ncbi:MAG: grhN [Acidimicrobiia bacterium]
MNPIMRLVLRTPLGRAVRPFALLEFEGRRTRQRLRIPVGYHEIDEGHVVFTPAPWRANFRDGRRVTVYFRGVRADFLGTLDEDPAQVAAAFASLMARQGSLRRIGVDIPADHQPTPADAKAVDRCLIRFSST